MGNEDPRAALADCLADLADNKPAEAVLARLRALEPALRDDPVSRARFLRARAIATNRLGFAGEALGDLHEARRLLEGGDHGQELAEIFRAIATVFSWRGESREAALALLRVVAEAGDDRLTIALALIEGGRLQMEIGRPADAQALFVRALAASAELPRREFQRAWVNLLQASVAAGRIEQARAQRGAMNETLAGAPPRLLLLTELEAARCAIAARKISALPQPPSTGRRCTHPRASRRSSVSRSPKRRPSFRWRAAMRQTRPPCSPPSSHAMPTTILRRARCVRGSCKRVHWKRSAAPTKPPARSEPRCGVRLRVP